MFEVGTSLKVKYISKQRFSKTCCKLNFCFVYLCVHTKGYSPFKSIILNAKLNGPYTKNMSECQTFSHNALVGFIKLQWYQLGIVLINNCGVTVKDLVKCFLTLAFYY